LGKDPSEVPDARVDEAEVEVPPDPTPAGKAGSDETPHS